MTYTIKELLLIFPIIYLSVYIFRYLILSFGALGLTSLISKERKIQSSREFTKSNALAIFNAFLNCSSVISLAPKERLFLTESLNKIESWVTTPVSRLKA